MAQRSPSSPSSEALAGPGARRARNIGSPLYGVLLDGLLADYRRGGITATLLDGVTDKPLHDALPLRYLGDGSPASRCAATRPTWPPLSRRAVGSWDGTRRGRSTTFLDDGRSERGRVPPRRAAQRADQRGRSGGRCSRPGSR